MCLRKEKDSLSLKTDSYVIESNVYFSRDMLLWGVCAYNLHKIGAELRNRELTKQKKLIKQAA